MAKIAFFELEEWEKDYLKDKLNVESLGEVEIIDGILTAEKLPAENDFEVISVFVNSVIDEEVLDHFPNLKLLVTRSTGFDHINLELCKDKGVQVANVPSYGEDTVAEYTFALLLTLSRKVYESFDRIKETGSFNLSGLRGFDLKGKTLGVIGTGKIGKNVIQIAKGFDMEVIAYDKFPSEDYAAQMGYRYLSFEEVLKGADILTLHVPYVPENHHLINENSIALMKKGVFLLNTSRGAVVDTQALVRALKEGQIAGAGLDVLEEEGIIKDELNYLTEREHPGNHDLRTVLANHLLIDMPNVVVTPHNAFNTWEALQRILQTTVEDIKSYLAQSPLNIVNK